jgi:hypothetical protein
MARTKQTAKKSTGGGRRQLATMRAAKAPTPPLIRTSRHQLTTEQYKKYKFLVFSKPELRNFEVDGEAFERYRVTVKDKKKKLLGYLPLPEKYHDAWVQLCYNVAYNQHAFRILHKLREAKELSLSQRTCAEKAAKSIGAILRQYLLARRLIMIELMDNGGGTEWLHPDHCLVTFNEYIIKERFDYHWTRPKPAHVGYFTRDALGEDMKTKMSEYKVNQYQFC